MAADEEKPGDSIEKEKVFKEVKYYVIGTLEDSIEKLLQDGGGSQESYLTDRVTHVIAEEDDHPEISEARDLFDLPVVSPSWVEMSLHCGRVLPTKAFQPEKSQLFSNVKACFSQMCARDREALWAMVTFYGGSCQLNLNKHCTHLITPSTEGAKYECAVCHADVISIVTPDWIIDTINAKKLQATKTYHPSLVVIKVPETDSEVPMETDSTVIDGNDSQSQETSQDELKASQDAPGQLLTHGTPQKQAMKAVFKMKAPWQQELPLMPELPPVADIAPPPVSHRKHKKEKKKKKKKNKDKDKSRKDKKKDKHSHERHTGTASPSSSSTITEPNSNSPMSNSLPRTLRNITNGVDAFMPTMPQGGEKRQMSQVLSAIAGMASQQQTRNEMMNANLPLPEQKTYYGHDPTYTLAGENCLLGCIFLIIEYPQLLGPHYIATWRKVISEHGGIVDDCYSDRITHLLCDSQRTEVFSLAIKDGKRCVTANWLNDCLKIKKMQPPWRALHFPVIAYPLQPAPCKDQVISMSGFEGGERNDVKTLIELLGAKYTGYFTRGNTLLVCNRMEGAKYEKAQEWRIPVINVQWLNDLVLGNHESVRNLNTARYQLYDLPDPFKIDKYGHMCTSLMDPWTVPLKISHAAKKKFLSNLGQKAGQLMKRKCEQGFPLAKRQRKGSMNVEEDWEGSPRMLDPDKIPYVLFTGIDSRAIPELIKKLEKLGGRMADTMASCTHLVTNKVTRTVKFLSGVSVCRFIVTPMWIEESYKSRWFLDENSFLLNDLEAEAAFSFKLKESMARASQRKLLKDVTLYLTPGVQPGPTLIRDIIEMAGGRLLTSRPSLAKISAMQSTMGASAFVVISCENDLPWCRDFFRHKIDVHNAEFVLTGVLRQQLDFTSFRFSPP
ncbi:PAX-interacting protein 1-like isoform X2 [Acanthaster planci]|uniref:PAX-interacting protein 1 n=1 Tax=Acanthaster planci TaxID=133434 RepID=A0A8B7YRK9_ACAPL|nr:PAX-interacting protein 1-like isoform X2 [Acanthaster planci]